VCRAAACGSCCAAGCCSNRCWRVPCKPGADASPTDGLAGKAEQPTGHNQQAGRPVCAAAVYSRFSVPALTVHA
jgi:hypothetical protein